MEVERLGKDEVKAGPGEGEQVEFPHVVQHLRPVRAADHVQLCNVNSGYYFATRVSLTSLFQFA